MKDQLREPELFDEAARGGGGDEKWCALGGWIGPASNFDLKLLLEEWREPCAPESLQFRVVNSFRLQWSVEEVVMNRCPKCRREFAPQYKFCPVDGLPLSPGFYLSPPDELRGSDAFADEIVGLEDELAYAKSNGGCSGDQLRKVAAAAAARAAGSGHSRRRAEYHLTFVEDAGLFVRLSVEVREAARESQLTWPELKRDPRGFVRRGGVAYARALGRFFAQPNVASGALAGLSVVLLIVCAVVVVGRLRQSRADVAQDRVLENLQVTQWVTEVPPPPEKTDEGRPGMAKGTGGGSKPKQEDSGGGGGGGRREAKPASGGKLPIATLAPPIVAPNPRPPINKNPSLPVMATLQADPTLFPPDTRLLPYGDPKSTATELSSGTGNGNGIGDGNGVGVGPGNGNGYGPGEGMNTGDGPPKLGGGGPGGPIGVNYDKTFPPKDVSRRAVILSRPEPQYTEEARKNSVTGEVTIRAVLSSSGQVTNITPLKRLPDGLTEKAIAAAKQIKFTPAEKDGRAVSQYITLVYNFNIY